MKIEMTLTFDTDVDAERLAAVSTALSGVFPAPGMGERRTEFDARRKSRAEAGVSCDPPHHDTPQNPEVGENPHDDVSQTTEPSAEGGRKHVEAATDHEALIHAEGLKTVKSTTDGAGNRVKVDDTAVLHGETVVVAALGRGRAVVVTEDNKAFVVNSADLNAPTEPTEGDADQTPETDPGESGQTPESSKGGEPDPLGSEYDTMSADDLRTVMRDRGNAVKRTISVNKVVECLKSVVPDVQLLKDVPESQYVSVIEAFDAALAEVEK